MKEDKKIAMVVWKEENHENKIINRVILTNEQFENITKTLNSKDSKEARKIFEDGIVDARTKEKVCFNFDEIIEISFEQE